MTLRPDRFCNYVYAWAVERVENREEFDRELAMPLPGRSAKPSEAVLEQEGQEFLSFMGAMTGSMG